MKTKHCAAIVFALFACPCAVTAQATPTSAQIYASATNFWYGNNLAGFTTYATNLYSGAATNKIAPALLSAFHDYVFLGELVSASNKYARVQMAVSAAPAQFDELFQGMLSMALNSVADNIKRYNAASKPLADAKALASPQEIRDDTADMPFILPHLLILSLAPDVQLQ